MGSRKYLPLKSKDVIRVLEKKGFVFKRQSGSHAFYEGIINDKRRVVCAPDYSEYKDKSLIKSIIDQSGLDWTEFYK